MISEIDTELFFYVVVVASIVLSALWYFVIAPMERRNHERKLAILKQKIKRHEEDLKTTSPRSIEPKEDAGD